MDCPCAHSGCAKRVRVPTALADALGGQERHPGAVAVAAQGPHITQRRARLWVLEPSHAQLLRGAAGHVEHLSKKTHAQNAGVSGIPRNCILSASASLARLRAKQGSVAPSSLTQSTQLQYLDDARCGAHGHELAVDVCGHGHALRVRKGYCARLGALHFHNIEKQEARSKKQAHSSWSLQTAT